MGGDELDQIHLPMMAAAFGVAIQKQQRAAVRQVADRAVVSGTSHSRQAGADWLGAEDAQAVGQHGGRAAQDLAANARR